MRRVFANTLFWIAVVNPNDQWHRAARAVEATLKNTQIVTTEEVLTELLAALAGAGEHRRAQVVTMVRLTIANPDVLVVPQSHESFMSGLALYQSRPDKRYSLTDCISMNVCRSEGIVEVLTNDRHFEQEGFTLLIGG